MSSGLLKVKLNFNLITRLKFCNLIGEGNIDPSLIYSPLLVLFIDILVRVHMNRTVLRNVNTVTLLNMAFHSYLILVCPTNSGMNHFVQPHICIIDFQHPFLITKVYLKSYSIPNQTIPFSRPLVVYAIPIYIRITPISLLFVLHLALFSMEILMKRST